MLLYSLSPRPLTSTLFPYTTLFRSFAAAPHRLAAGARTAQRRRPRSDRASGAGRPADPLLGARHGRFAHPRRSEEHTSELQSQFHLVCRLLLEKKKGEFRHLDSVPP